jgi:autotransporter strand-loop-strand O-heptosyltransferase
MAHKEQQDFCSSIRDKYPNYFVGKKVLDIGSLDINGNNRFLFTDCDYLGLDVGGGSNVDVISVGHLYDAPDEYFDTIISTEVFEHDMFYEETVKNIIRMLKPGGAFIFTCAGEGRPEHGTRRCGEFCAPLLSQISDDWADYYKNLMQGDFLNIDGFKETFPDGFFIYNQDVYIPSDLYFFGVKGGIEKSQRYLPKKVEHFTDTNYNSEEYKDDIFVLGAWPDTEEKENDLIDCISRLRVFEGIPILLVTHYPVKEEIQKLVDYYIYDKNNDLLKHEEFAEYAVASGRWTNMQDHKVINELPYHHDYAIWISMKNAFNFCKYLGKERVHYMEYDNLIDVFQYRQSFLERSKNHDVVLYEYNENSTKDTHFAPFCATYIFSGKTDILVAMMNEVNSKREYFMNRPNGWQLERVFLHYLQKHTNNFTISPYVANNNELNTQAVWNRDGIFREGIAFQIYPCVDDNDELYLHLISGFHETHCGEDVLLEIRYDGNQKFIELLENEYKTIHLGEYKRGLTARVFLFGKEIFTQFLIDKVETFREMNKLIWNEPSMINPQKNDITVNMNFVDGAFVEILGNKKRIYNVKFIDEDTNIIVFEINIKNNEWAKCNRKWFTKWLVRIESDGMETIEHRYDATGKRVFISLESSSLGDTLAWLPYAEEFKKKHNCTVIVSTFLNNLFKDQYPELEFANRGVSVDNLYALYRLGCFYDENGIDMSKHKTDFKKLRLQEYASDILGLDFEEIRPRMKSIEPMKSDKPYICIANHSTAQSKYWNNPTGWQELVDYVKDIGYDVYLLSKEEDGYMDNKNPTGVIKVNNKTLEEIGSILLGSEGFVGISSGLSWLAWALEVPTILISGCTEEVHEPLDNVQRVINTNVCNSCFSTHSFDKGDWNWCPLHKGTDRQFECSKEIPFSMVRPKIDKMLSI